MTVVDALEAKKRFARLLDRVMRGEQIVITRHGTPVARLVPVRRPDRDRARRAIARLKVLRKGQTLGDISWKDLRDGGRR